MTGRWLWLTDLLVLLVVCLLGLALAEPDPLTASFHMVVPLSPPLVSAGDGPRMLADPPRPDPLTPAPDASEPALDSESAGAVEAYIRAGEPLTAQLRGLDGRRSDLKLALEAMAVRIGGALPPENVAQIYRDRLKRARETGELLGMDERIAAWRCDGAPGPDSP